MPGKVGVLAWEALAYQALRARLSLSERTSLRSLRSDRDDKQGRARGRLAGASDLCVPGALKKVTSRSGLGEVGL